MNNKVSAKDIIVLILVVMEDTLREYIDLVSVNPVCLNPCCNGRYSQRNYIISENTLLSVLILVVMEDTLRDFDYHILDLSRGLNPCCNGRYSQSLVAKGLTKNEVS